VSREPAGPRVATVEPELLAFLHARRHEPALGWEPDPPIGALHCHPDLVARLAEIARPVRGTRRVFVAGCPVITHPHGTPIAAASGTSWLAVRSGEPAGELASRWHTPGLEPPWTELDPFASDVTFARGTDRLRAHVTRAFTLAGAIGAGDA